VVIAQGASLNVLVDNSQSATLQGVISDEGTGGNLVKNGAGTLALGGHNTYTGGTTVNAGTLLVNGSVAGGSVTVADGAVLGGTGSIGGPTTVELGGTLSPGQSLGMLTFLDDLTLDVGAKIHWEFKKTGDAGDAAGTDYDSITGTNLLLPASGLYDPVLDNKLLAMDIVGVDGYSLKAGDSFTLFAGDVFLGTTPLNPGDDITHLFDISDHSGWWGTWEVSAGSLILTAVPEPCTWLMLLSALACGLLWRKR
jgi:autotransporter-associated beta strand protein